MLPDTVITNEPVRIKCGAPDYIITRAGIPIGYFEAKDVDADLLSKGYKEQFDRYRASLPNLIITNYLDFHWYKDGELVTQISLASIE
ncbi:MAG: adenine specific DNA methyltransferase, partial [bacterium]